MTHIETFGSFEDMQKYMSDQHEAAMGRINDHQRELLGKTKFWWVSPRPDMDLTIFGEYDFDAWVENERRLWDDEDGPFEGHHARMKYNNLERGYKTGRAFSTWEPTGELGDTHVTMMWEISEQAFLEAKTVAWDIPNRMNECPTLRREIIAHLSREEA